MIILSFENNESVKGVLDLMEREVLGSMKKVVEEGVKLEGIDNIIEKINMNEEDYRNWSGYLRDVYRYKEYLNRGCVSDCLNCSYSCIVEGVEEIIGYGGWEDIFKIEY